MHRGLGTSLVIVSRYKKDVTKRTRCYKKDAMLQKGLGYVTKRTECYKKDWVMLQKGQSVAKRNSPCYKKEYRCYKKESCMLPKGHDVTKRNIAFLFVTCDVTKRTALCYNKDCSSHRSFVRSYFI